MCRLNSTASAFVLALIIVAACSSPGGTTDANTNGGASPEASAVAP